jgi:predicted O-methyltransferase YrrM
MTRLARWRDRVLTSTLHRLDDYVASSRSLGLHAPAGTADEYRTLWERARREPHPEIDAFERDCAAAIDPEWLHALALATQVTKKESAICYQHGRLLYAALSRYLRTSGVRNPTVVETGTARGFSALCLARALDDAGVSGKVLTFDVLPHDLTMYWNCIQDLDGPRTRAQLLNHYRELLETYVIFHAGDSARELRKLGCPRVHFAFLDSVHTYAHVMAEFATLRERQRPGDVLFFDDYAPESYPGVYQAADEICATAGYTGTRLQASPKRAYLVASKQ